MIKEYEKAFGRGHHKIGVLKGWGVRCHGLFFGVHNANGYAITDTHKKRHKAQVQHHQIGDDSQCIWKENKYEPVVYQFGYSDEFTCNHAGCEHDKHC